MSITVKDLQPGQKYGFLYCPSCEAHYSADSRDYWNLPESHIFRCDECDEEMVLAREYREIEVLK